MTRQKSDAQLDAEAAVRVSERPLSESLEFHRLLYKDDLFIEQLSADEPPVFTDSHTGKRSSDLMSMLGPTLSWPLTRYITDQYGSLFPWSRALVAMRWTECRRFHREHWDRPEWRGSLCYQLVSFTVRREFSLEAACQVLGTTPDRSGRVLHNALRWIERRIDLDRQKDEERGQPVRGRILWGELIPHERHDQPGMHRYDCPQCQNGAA